MKATLKFNLDNPDDKKAHFRAIKSADLAFVIWEIDMNFRKKLYNQIELWGDLCTPEMIVDEFFKKFYELLEEHQVNSEELLD